MCLEDALFKENRTAVAVPCRKTRLEMATVPAYSPAMQNESQPVVPVLAFEDVSVVSEAGQQAVMNAFSLSVLPGEVVSVALERDDESLPFAELALGLQAPAGGTVRFGGRDWSAMGAFEQAAARGRCGAVFALPCWVSSLPVRENILLRAEYHTSTPTDELLADAMAKARLAGLADIDARRPDFVPTRELRVLEWVRAFTGDPALVVLVCPEDGAPGAQLAGLERLIRQAIEQGSGVLWFTRSHGSEALEVFRQSRRYRMQEDTVVALQGGAEHEQAV